MPLQVSVSRHVTSCHGDSLSGSSVSLSALRHRRRSKAGLNILQLSKWNDAGSKTRLFDKQKYMTNIVCCQISLLFSSYFQLEQVICSTSKYSPLQRPLPGSGTGDCGLSCLSHSFNTGRVGALTERSRLDYIRYQVVTQAGLFMLEM